MPALLIGTYFMRPKAPVELPNSDGTFTTYFFRPVDASNPKSEHVAVVTDPKHQQRLLAIAEGYYISEAQVVAEAAHAAAAVLSRPAPPQAPASAPAAVNTAAVETTVTPALPNGADAGTGAQSAQQTEPSVPVGTGTVVAADLLALPLKQFKTAIVDASPTVLNEALSIEQARAEDEVRPTYVKALQAQLKA